MNALSNGRLLIVSLVDAVVYPLAVMVEVLHAPVALAAVMDALADYGLAKRAEMSPISSQLNVYLPSSE